MQAPRAVSWVLMCVVAVAAASSASAQNRYFVGARNLGMGSTGVGATSDALAVHFNPAGMAFNRAHLGIMRLAAIALIVTGGCTTVAIYLGHQCGVIEQKWSGPIVLLLAFVAHSSYGWLLLTVSARLNR